VPKIVNAKYDAAENVLRLVEPLEGVEDDANVQLQFIASSAPEPPSEPERPWLAMRGIMSKEDGEDFARALNELFPSWE
jgi:hypothetical protein